jgi:hypothetical protein
MINPFLLPADDRLAHWQQFRKSLSDQSELQQLAAVGQYWSTAPLRSIAYDCDAPATWPTIWEMIRAGEWCRNSIAIGMAGTLLLLGFDPGRLCVGLLHDHDLSVLLLVVRIDRDWLLNYDWGLLTALPTTKHHWVRRYHWTGRGYLEV